MKYTLPAEKTETFGEKESAEMVKMIYQFRVAMLRKN